MLSKLILLFTPAISIAIIMSGCSSPTSPSSSTPPTITVPTFAGPGSTSACADTSTGAQVALAAAADFNAILQDFSLFFRGQGTEQGNIWTWTSNSTSLTATATATVSGGTYSLSVLFNGTYQNANYSDSQVLNGTQSSDGKSGNWSITTPSEDAQLTWSTGSNAALTGTVITSGSYNEKDVLTNNADRSGELQVYSNSVLTIDVTWNSNGSGTWTAYDSKGNPTVSGSWS